jgi:hypothetical protein
MNLIPMIAKELGVEIGEEFNAKHANIGKILTNSKEEPAIFKFGNDGLYSKCSDGSGDFFLIGMGNFLKGDYEIVKIPFEPKDGERYWTVYWKEIGDMPCAVYETWRDDSCDFANKVSGNCFRTEAEAEKHKYEIYEKLTGKKWKE